MRRLDDKNKMKIMRSRRRGLTRRDDDDDDDDDETETWFYCGVPDWGLAGFTTAVHRHSALPSSSSSSLSSSVSGFILKKGGGADIEHVTSGTTDT